MYFLRKIGMFSVLTLGLVSPPFAFATDAVVPSKAYVDDTFVEVNQGTGTNNANVGKTLVVNASGDLELSSNTLSSYQNPTYTASDGVTLTNTNFTNSGVRSVATGTTAGTVAVNTNGTTTDVAVNGFSDKQTKPATVANGQVLTYTGSDANANVSAGYIKVPVAAGAPSSNTPTSFVEIWIQ